MLQSIKRFFVRAKAWQLFLLFIVPSVLIQLPGPELLNPFVAISVVTPILMFCVGGWMWSIGTLSNDRLAGSLKKSTRIYSGGLLFAFIYTSLFEILVLVLHIPFQIILPLHLAAMFFMFYALWFTAQQFMTLQRQEPSKFMDFSGPFFLMWFFPLGVWFIQPKVNELFSTRQ